VQGRRVGRELMVETMSVEHSIAIMERILLVFSYLLLLAFFDLVQALRFVQHPVPVEKDQSHLFLGEFESGAANYHSRDTGQSL